MSVFSIGQMGHLRMSLQMVCEHFVMNRVVMKGFMYGNVDIFLGGKKRGFLVKDAKLDFT